MASKFTFFLAIPVMFGASALKLVKYFIKGGTFGTNEIAILGVAASWPLCFAYRHQRLGFVRRRLRLRRLPHHPGHRGSAYFFVLEPMLGLCFGRYARRPGRQLVIQRGRHKGLCPFSCQFSPGRSYRGHDIGGSVIVNRLRKAT
ncbi:MAG: hypothetical protein ACLRM9_07330 [Collinsella aerofaciens]